MAKKQYPPFQVWCYSKDAANDDEVRKVAGREDFGSGMGFGARDISFFANDKEEALKMKNRLLFVKGVVRVEVINEKDRTEFFPLNMRRTFDSCHEQHKNRVGQEFVLSRSILVPDEKHDLEVLPMHVIMFSDGTEIEAWTEEVFTEA